MVKFSYRRFDNCLIFGYGLCCQLEGGFAEAFCLCHVNVCYVVLDTVGKAGTMSDDHTSRTGL